MNYNPDQVLRTHYLAAREAHAAAARENEARRDRQERPRQTLAGLLRALVARMRPVRPAI